MYLNKDLVVGKEDHDLNAEILNYLLDNVYRGEDGRLIIPILWNDKVKHLLSQNFDLSWKVLKSNLKKYSKDPNKLQLMNDNIRELESAGIIEKLSIGEGTILRYNNIISHGHLFKF